MKLGKLIRDYRSDHDMTQEDFATKSGLSKGYVSMLESGKNPRTGKPLTPSLQVTKQVADAIGMSLSDVLAMTEALEWDDTISRDNPTQEELVIYNSLSAADVVPIWKEYLAQLRPFLKTMDEGQLKQLVQYARFLVVEGKRDD